MRKIVIYPSLGRIQYCDQGGLPLAPRDPNMKQFLVHFFGQGTPSQGWQLIHYPASLNLSSSVLG